LGLKIERARFAVAISSFGRSQLCRWSDPEHWPRIHVVHCAIEAERFGAPAALPDREVPHLVAIGRLAPQKGFGLLIDAMAIAVPDLPDLTLTLVGDGPLRAALTGAVELLGLTGHVKFAGWQDEAGVRAALAASHALILPSFAEGLPVVVMEAFADGRPVIATAIAGVPELVTSKTGWLVPAGDARAGRRDPRTGRDPAFDPDRDGPSRPRAGVWVP
jgi:colanic acid/amylovoran biosynthesis glycosyltransferase